MKINMADYSGYASNNIGVSFSSVPYTNNVNSMVHKNHSLFHEASIVKDSIGWIKIRGSFIADSNYRYIMLGNFYSDSLTDVELLNPKHFKFSYYYIDDICVSEDSMTCFNYVSIKRVSDKPLLEVYPNPFNDVLNIKFWKIGQKRMTIYNSLSNIVFQAYFTESISIFDLKSLPEGVYFCTVEDDSGLIFKSKLLKN